MQCLQESWRSQAKSKWWTQGRYSTCKSQLHIQNPDSLHLWGSGQPDLEGFVAEDNCCCIHSYLILLLTLFLAQDTLIRSAEEILHYNAQNSCHLQPLGPWQNWVKTETTTELAWNTNRTNMVEIATRHLYKEGFCRCGLCFLCLWDLNPLTALRLVPVTGALWSSRDTPRVGGWQEEYFEESVLWRQIAAI